MRRLREVVRSNNVFRWAGSMLLDAARVRKRGQLRAIPGGGASSAESRSDAACRARWPPRAWGRR